MKYLVRLRVTLATDVEIPDNIKPLSDRFNKLILEKLPKFGEWEKIDVEEEEYIPLKEI